jgi:flagellin
MQVINSNVASLNAQRNLSASGSQLASSLQRLSSGLRINSAKDDAAGLAISERFSTQIRGLNVAARNANDGISLAQTAEGGLAEIGNNLQRIRELAVQAVNATNSASDRVALDSEAQQLKAEIERVATQTEFNGKKLLDGSFIGQAFQIGSNAGQLLNVSSIGSARLSGLGSTLSVPDAFRVVAPPGTTVGTSLPLSIDVSNLSFDQQAPTARAAQDSFLQAVATAFDNAAVSSATYNATTGELRVRNDTWASLIVGLDNIGGTTANLSVGQTLSMNVSSLSLSVINEADSAQLGLQGTNLLSASEASAAILELDTALQAVNSQRAELGALQNRFASVIQNLQTSSENLTASRSRIRDADYAKETAELTRTQILQQAGTAMLAQANQLPQNVLSLLR